MFLVCVFVTLFGQQHDKKTSEIDRWKRPAIGRRARFPVPVILLCRAMLCISAAYAVARCLSACLSVVFVYSVSFFLTVG